MRATLMLATALTASLALLPMSPAYRAHEPADYVDRDPVTVVIWLHGYRMNENQCPLINDDQGRVIVAPVFNRDAVWQNYDMRKLVRHLRKVYNVARLEIEGYSRGAYGAAYHASANPGMFSEVRCLAGRFDDHPIVVDPLIVVGGARDHRLYDDSVAYAAAMGVELITVDSGHHPVDFYNAFDPIKQGIFD